MGEADRSAAWSASRDPVIHYAAEDNAFIQIIDNVIVGENASIQFVVVIRVHGACIPEGKRAAVFRALNRLTTGLGLPPGPGKDIFCDARTSRF